MAALKPGSRIVSLMASGSLSGSLLKYGLNYTGGRKKGNGNDYSTPGKLGHYGKTGSRSKLDDDSAKLFRVVHTIFGYL